jgi:peptidoglycan/xylan/chitin deacetylase (PgdA/CDA1 family)
MVLAVLIVVGALAVAHTAPFPFLLEAFRPARSVWRVPPAAGAPPTVYLTFDDGPNPTWTPPLLDALRDGDVRATFFLIDEHVTADTAPIVRRMAEEGHAVALHSGTRALIALPPDTLARRLTAAADRLEAITGDEPCRLFRPHAGWRSLTMYLGVERAGFRLAGWSWGMWDWDWWRTPRADRVARKLARKASAGDIVVIHDGHHRRLDVDRRHAAESVRQLVPILRGRGFRFAPLCGAGGRPAVERRDRAR